MTLSTEELAAMGIEDPGHLEVQQESIRRWNELIYSGASDGKGTQLQFVRSVLGRDARG